MNAHSIKDEIKKKVEHTTIGGKHPPLSEKYGHWYIGVTKDPDRRKGEHDENGEDVSLWRSWPADTVTIARDVEEYFQNLGMRGGGGGGTNPNYVYIF